MRIKWVIFLTFFLIFLSSCISVKQLRLMQDKGNLKVDDNGFAVLIREEYKLRVNDVLNINISSFDNQAIQIFGRNIGSKENQISVSEGSLYIQGISVDLDGNIELPIIGIIPVQGLTQREIKSILHEKLKSIFKEDSYYVRVQLAGIPFSVIGEVNRKGRFRIYKNDVNILEAIAQAGGLGVTANRKKVILQREYPEGIKTFTIDMTDNKLINSPLYFIQPNDIIMVNPLPQKTIGTGTKGLNTFITLLDVLSKAINTYFIIHRL